MSVDLQISKSQISDSSLSSPNPHIEPPVPILPRVATGATDAIEICLDRYSGLVWSLARRSCPDQQTAEDAVQDVFIQIWRYAERFDPAVSSEPTFVAMIARRRLIDRHRKKQNSSQTALTEPSQFADVPANQPGVDENVELQDEALRAEKFLSKLPAKQQDVIRMSIYDGISHSRIAEATGLSLGTVKTNIRRGLAELRRQLFAADPEVGRSA